MAGGFKHVIIDPYKMTTDRWSVVVQRSYKHCRRNKYGTKIIVKYKGMHPILFFGYTTYSDAEIKEIIETNSEWIPEEIN